MALDIKKIFKITIWHVVVLVWAVALLAYYVNRSLLNILVFSIVAISTILMVAQMIRGDRNITQKQST